MSKISISNKWIGEGQPTFIIAEIGQAHDGSLGIAHSFIDAVADAGADAVKFQTHLAEVESTLDEPFRVDFSYEDDSRYSYWKRMEFTQDQWRSLAEHARKEGLVFLSTAFSKEAVDLLRTVDMPAWKVGSGEYRSHDLVDYMTDTGLPILLSTGMSTYEEIEAIVEIINAKDTPFAIFQCTSNYPTPLEKVGLNVIDEFRARFGCPVGLSDHTNSIYSSLAAIFTGADLLEVHVTFDSKMFGPDTATAIGFSELATLTKARDAAYIINHNPVDKNEMAEWLSEIRSLFGKSIATTEPLDAGTILTEDLITPKKPATGIPYEQKNDVLGLRLKKDVDPNRLLKWADLDV
jgi:N-acetylneuraminate synthase